MTDKRQARLVNNIFFSNESCSNLDMSFLLRTFLALVFVASVYSEEEVFNITRLTALDKTDQFVIPTSMCNQTPHQSGCSRFHIRAFILRRKCECYCPYEASTFGFDSGSWKCLKNTEFRTQAGCTYRFQSEYDTYPLQVLETTRPQRQFTISLPSDSCKIDILSSRYLRCDGSWSGLGLSEKSDIFKLVRLSENYHGSSWDYKIEITKKASLAGKAIKLQLDCAPASELSCILFKIAGKMTCPVDPTKKSNVSGGQSGGSSGTAAAVVIVIILVVIVAAIIGFIIWKRKRGENVWLMDRISSIATILRNRSSSKVKEEGQQQEQIYAEIPDQRVQPSHSQNTSEAATQNQAGTRTAILLSGGIVAPEQPTDDDDGYAEPPDSPEYNELEDPNEQSTGDVSSQCIDSNSRLQGGPRGPASGPATTGTELSTSADNRYVTKQRRKPPSPPQKGNGTKERGLDVNDGANVKEEGEEGQDKNHDYESLRDENRDVYQPLDRNIMENR